MARADLYFRSLATPQILSIDFPGSASHPSTPIAALLEMAENPPIVPRKNRKGVPHVPPLNNEERREFDERFRSLSNSPEGAIELIKLARKHKLPVSNFLDYKEKLTPSFSKLTWNHAKQLYGLKSPSDIPVLVVDLPFISEELALKLFTRVDEADKTTSSLHDADREAKVVAWLILVISKIVVLFDGAISNDHEGNLRGFDGGGGRVEFIYLVLDLCIVLIVEAKYGQDNNNNFAQIMVELEAADQQNCLRNLSIEKVFGVLASARTWYFWSYTGGPTATSFAVSTPFIVTSNDPDSQTEMRLETFRAMWVFFLNGFLLALGALMERSNYEANEEAMQKGFNPDQYPRRPSYRKWQEAHSHAQNAVNLSKSAKNDQEFNQVLAVLKMSLNALPDEHSQTIQDVSSSIKALYSRGLQYKKS
ncbi:hypothetical protein PtB15_8B410 [Puccinia triticina]|nr:hypothetical protein PtB15_8B410 [Puccinia triticina]